MSNVMNERKDFAFSLGIQPNERFIHEEEAWARQDRTTNRYPPLFSA